MRKEPRKGGARTQHLVEDVETEMVSWLHDETVFLSPDEKDDNELEFPGKPVGDSGAIVKSRGRPRSSFGGSLKMGSPDTWYIAAPGTIISSVLVSVPFESERGGHVSTISR